MNVGGRQYRTIWVAEDGRTVEIIDQTKLPHAFATGKLATLDDAVHAIESMRVRGAPLIGVTAAYGLCLALSRDASDAVMNDACQRLLATRPTAVNLRAALGRMTAQLAPLAEKERVAAGYALAAELADEDVARNRAIGEHGLSLLKAIAGVPSTQRTTAAFQCTSGSRKRARAIRGLPSRRGSSPNMAFLTRPSSTARLVI
jgi:methylthioribose-1-phosphate isomerase